jgi:hypothetical protein
MPETPDLANKKAPWCPGLSVIKRLLSPRWWRHAWAFTWAFKRRLRTPSLLFFIGACLLMNMIRLMVELNVKPDGQPIDASIVLPKLLIALFSSTTGGILCLIAMSQLVFRLTLFTRAYLRFPLLDQAPAQESIKESFVEANTSLGTHKGYLAQCLLITMLIAMPLSLVFTACFFIGTFASVPDTQSLTLPPELRAVAPVVSIITGILFIVLSNYSVVSAALICLINRTVGSVTKHALFLTLTTLPLLAIGTALVAAVSTVVSTPMAALAMINPAMQVNILDASTFGSQVGAEVWQTLAGFIVYPIGSAFLLEIIRDASLVPPAAKDRLETA